MSHNSVPFKPGSDLSYLTSRMFVLNVLRKIASLYIVEKETASHDHKYAGNIRFTNMRRRKGSAKANHMYHMTK